MKTLRILRGALIVVALLLFSIEVSVQQTAAMPDLRRDDAAIVRLVLDCMIFPELAKFGNRVPAAMLLVEDHSNLETLEATNCRT